MRESFPGKVNGVQNPEAEKSLALKMPWGPYDRRSTGWGMVVHAGQDLIPKG